MTKSQGLWPMQVRIEFYGIVRQRTGTSCCDLETNDDSLQLSEVLLRLEQQYPALAGDCLDHGQLLPGYLANLDGKQFVTDPDTPVSPGQSVLILSADIGG
jgi:molybdopterin converting factor small subunit